MTDEELNALVEDLRDKGFISQREADAITALRTKLAEVQEELSRRVDMHECAMAERDDATLYGVEQKARADLTEAALTAQQSPDVAALVEAAEKLLDAYSAIVGAGNPWGDELRATLARVKGGE